MRKKIIKIGSIVSAIVMGLALIILPFSGKKMPNAYNLICSADEVTLNYSYTISDVYQFDAVTTGISGGFTVNPFTFSGILTAGDTGLDLQYYFVRCSYDTDIHYYTYWAFDDNGIHRNNISIPFDTLTWFSFNDSQSSFDSFKRLYLYFKVDSGFNCNIYMVNLFVSSTSLLHDSDSRISYLYYKYYDENDKIFLIEVPVAKSFSFNSRIYYINPALTETQQYNSGYTAGQLVGESEGYSKGYTAGQNVGYNNGFSAGVASANDYSFLGLIGAVVDVPVQTFTNLFNFQLLGINLAGFFTGLLTLAFIITIVKLLL